MFIYFCLLFRVRSGKFNEVFPRRVFFPNDDRTFLDEENRIFDPEGRLDFQATSIGHQRQPLNNAYVMKTEQADAFARFLASMYGLEINQLATLLKDCDPNRNDSDSDEEQVRRTRFVS